MLIRAPAHTFERSVPVIDECEPPAASLPFDACCSSPWRPAGLPSQAGAERFRHVREALPVFEYRGAILKAIEVSRRGRFVSALRRRFRRTACSIR